MPDTNRRRNEKLLAKHHQGELSPAEKLELTQRSFQDEDLFDALVIDGLIKDSLEDPGFREQWLANEPLHQPKVRVGPPAWVVAVAAGLAVVAVASVYFLRQRARPESRLSAAGQSPPRPFSAPANLIPQLGPAGDADRPILLADRLENGESHPIVFRGGNAAARLPHQSGIVTESAGDAVTIGLGLTDGLSDGLALGISRGGKNVGTVQVTTLFRDQSRARLIHGGPILVGDQVRVPLDARLEALWGRADALSSSGDNPAARQLAQAALDMTQSARGGPRLSTKAQERLAEAEFKAGDVAAARQRLRDAIKASDAAGDTGPSDAWEVLGVISLLSGDLQEAQSALAEAERRASLADSPVAHARALNNLAVVAEMSGDRARAEQFLVQAGQFLAEGPPSRREKKAIQGNLERLRRSK